MTMPITVAFTRLTQFLESEGGQLVVSFDDHRDEWVVGLTFGKEAEDSDMAGGASYATGNKNELAECMEQIVQEVRA